ncbi:proton-associated sugar transporter A-like, partial [Culicoides brevitarsis]|uniref:proton-associated sugar transporter A-like n=1 Tax=Culicoides brevitarsis TaxID=469753 RepID=UPI00307C1099
SKTRAELVRVSSAVMGIEFSYAAETAFVSPTLLKIGVAHQKMTLVWGLSPLVGFFLTPILGSLSDRCRSNFGRRRPFILLLSVGVFLGLLLVPNGVEIGYWFGDPRPVTSEFDYSAINGGNSTTMDPIPAAPKNEHPWGIFFTILGTVLLDFDADACQSPSRAYLLDVTLPENHARGLTTFTIMAGLGGFMGYSLGGINWDDTFIGVWFGGHVRAVFSLITIIFVICIYLTITSFAEIPLWMIEGSMNKLTEDEIYGEEEAPVKTDIHRSASDANLELNRETTASYGATGNSLGVPENPFQSQRRNTMPSNPFKSDEYAALPGANVNETSFTENASHLGQKEPSVEASSATLKHYLLSIVFMPFSLRIVCLTNLFCWMAHVSYSLYFTDFVGEAVFGGDPKAPPGSVSYELYQEGVRFGCWGMAMYSLSCSCYSLIIEKLIKRFKAKPVYIGGLVFYSTGMTLMALTKHPVGVILFSWTAGVMYSTLFTMPYLLVAAYHDKGVFSVTNEGVAESTQVRGLGTDVAIVSSMVFLAQFILSMGMGTVVSVTGTTTAVVSVASFLAFCGAISASQIMYLDL